MARITFQVKIQGPKPDEVSASYLADVLRRIETSIVELARANSLAFPESGPALSLIDVEEGSDLLTFSISEPVAPAIAVISNAVATHEYSALSREAHSELYGLSERLRGAGWGMEILANDRAGIKPAAITPDRGVDAPAALATISGTTTLLARCLRVGGATQPKAELRLTQGGHLLHVKVSEIIARHLGKHLYDEVLLAGLATWRTDTWEVTDFRVKSVSEFNRVTPSVAFRELAEQAGDILDDADAWQLVINGREEK